MNAEEFLDLVAKMRSAQQRYFRGDKSGATLSLSKSLERQVDKAIDDMLNPQLPLELRDKDS
jgi:hypothetical protein